jgi:hypothetical protein
VVAGAGVAWPFDSVGVVPGAADDAGVGAVPPWGVEVARAGDIGHDRSEELPGLVRGKGRVCGPAADDADGAQELDPAGVDAGFGGGLADQRRDGVVDEQVAVDLLADHVRAFGRQYRAGAAQAGFELVIAGFLFPPLSLASASGAVWSRNQRTPSTASQKQVSALLPFGCRGGAVQPTATSR